MEQQKDTNQGAKHNGQTTQSHQGYGYIMRKAEKLTTALYLVTDILADKEPMKWKAREAGVDVLSDITVAAGVSTSEKMSTLRVVLKKIEKLVSFLDVAASTRMMSEMNAGMLRKEYLALRDNIEAEWNRTGERTKTLLNERFFDVPNDLPDQTLPLQKRIETNGPVAHGVPVTRVTSPQNFVGSQNPRPQEQAPDQAREERTHSPEQTSSPKHATIEQAEATLGATEKVQPQKSFVARPTISDSDVIARSRPDVTRDDRRKIILALIKQKPAITVGDIAKSIPGISEKTIQRELLAMVAEGTLVKRGERRWSTYSLSM